MTHIHELFYRTTSEDGKVTLASFAKHNRNSNQAGEDLIDLIEGLAKSSQMGREPNAAIIYKIDGLCEYMISRAFYLWPNTREYDTMSPRKNRGRRNESSKNTTRHRRPDVR